MTTLTTALTTPGVLTEKKRISSIDTVCGLVMVLMVLDHVRAYFHYGAFVLLAGTSIIKEIQDKKNYGNI